MCQEPGTAVRVVVVVVPVVGVLVHLVLVDELVVVAAGHGGGLEHDGHVADLEGVGQEVLELGQERGGVGQALHVDLDVGGADHQVAAHPPAAQIGDAGDAGQGHDQPARLGVVEGGAVH